MKFLNTYRVYMAIGIIWLFHLSGIIGITLGFKDWFLPKTPLNLSICLLLFVLVYPLDTMKKIGVFLTFFGIGMFAEWLGVNYSLLFGDYGYGENFGPKLDGVPWLIGCFWALLAFITSEIAAIFTVPVWAKATLASGLMVFLDFLLEQNAPNFDYWQFDGHVPIKNYVTWFILGLLMQWILNIFRIQGNRPISIHLYLAQLIFFAYFWWVSV